MDQIKDLIGKYVFPALLIIVGLILLFYSLANLAAISGMFILAGVVLILTGATSGLFIMGKISKMIQNIMFMVFGLFTLVMIYANYNSISSEVAFRALKAEREAAVKQRMIDIRTAQLAYRNSRGYYSNNFDSLKYFLATDSMMVVTQFGDPNDSLQVANNLVRWDTTFVAVIDTFFLSPSALAKRTYPFSLDSLNIAPNEEGAEFILKTTLLSKGNLQVPAFLVVDPKPFDPKPDTLRLGSLTEATTNGNWKD